MAAKLGLEVVWLEGDWRHGASPERIADALTPDVSAVMVVHNETSTGVTSRVADVRAAMGDHDALLLVDTISSLASIDYRHDEWGVDVTVGGSQKGLMLPAGLSFNAVSEKALATAWLAAALLLGLGADHRRQPGRLLAVHERDQPLVRAARGAVDPAARGGAGERLRAPRPACRRRPARRSPAGGSRCWRSRSAILRAASPRSCSTGSDEVRRVILERFDMSLGAGLGRLQDQVFRIGHLGDFNDLTLAGTLCGVQMGLRLAGHDVGDGVGAALELLEQ